MTQDFNPLMDFARKVECSIKLPSNGTWYDDDVLEYNALGEIDIKPMLPNDEMMLVNPEMLISGETILKVIKSCCPTIHKPKELYYPDVNALLLGIKKATSGTEMKQDVICPKCWAKKNDIVNEKMVELIKKEYPDGNTELTEEQLKVFRDQAEEECKEQIAQMETDGELKVSPQTIVLDTDVVLGQMTMLPSNGCVELKNGIKVYTTPYKCIDKIRFINQQIQFQKVATYYKQHKQSLDNITEVNEELLHKFENITSLYSEVADKSMDILASSIKYIETPDGTKVDNFQFIKEFLTNTDAASVDTIQSKVEELNKCGIMQTIPCECECCGHTWDEKFYGFNQNDFFGIGS